MPVLMRASHEINNPLAALLGHTHILLMQPTLPPETRDRVERIQAAGARIRDIVARMARITRVEMFEHPSPGLPEMLDIRKSSEPGELDGRSAPP